MGQLSALARAGIDTLDFQYFAAGHFSSDSLREDVFNRHPDNYHLINSAGQATSYHGSGFASGASGEMTQGVVDAGEDWLWNSATSDWELAFSWSGPRVSMSALHAAGQTGSIGDDLALCGTIFQRGDVIGLSNADDHMRGFGGNDRMYGSGGNDLLKGDAGRDKLFDGKGKDALKGGSGDDPIRGGKGRDVEIGGAGSGTFQFETGDEKDFIKDFDATGADHDIVDLSGLAAVKGWNDLVNTHVERVGSDVKIDDLDGDVIVRRDVALGSPDKGDFLF